MNAEELACRIAAATQRVSLGDWGSVELVSLRGLPDAEEIVELADAWLLPEEIERGARFVAARDQLRFRWRRVALRSLLAKQIDVDPTAIRYSVGAWGKPSLEMSELKGQTLWWNLSDSDDSVLIAITTAGMVGVDIERHREIRELESLAESIMHPEEWEAWNSLHSAERKQAFFHLWSAKEAVVKSVGYGLSLAPRDLNVGVFFPAFCPTVIRFVGPDQRHWETHVRVLDLEAGFSTAVAGATPLRAS